MYKYHSFFICFHLIIQIGEGIAEVEIMGWMIEEGQEIEEFDEVR